MFADPSAALASAVAVQRAAGAEPWPPGLPIRVRVALHSGACVERDGDYFGPVVNRAARLLAAGHGGQVLVSGATHELLADRLPGGIGLRDLGEHRLKDLGRAERVFQVTGPGLAEGFGPLRSLDDPALRHNLPSQATSFVGRAAELAELRSLVSGGSRLVTIAGPGGIGKSRLALQVAAEALDGAGDGVWLVELAPVADPELVARTVAAVLGVREEPGRPMLDTLVEAVGDRYLLVVLDNAEHVLGAAAKLADAVHAVLPAGVPAGHEQGAAGHQRGARLPGSPAARPARRSGRPGRLAAFESVQLFAERAVDAPAGLRPRRRQRRGGGGGLRAAGRDSAGPGARRGPAGFAVGAGDQLPARSAVPAADRGEPDRPAPPSDPPRPDRLVLRPAQPRGADGARPAVGLRRGLDPGGRRSGHLAQATPENGRCWTIWPPWSTRAWSRPTRSDGSTRYRLLETVRQYAAERLALRAGSELDETRAAHRDHYLALVETAGTHLRGPDEAVWLDRLEAEFDNIRAALAFSLADPDSAEPGLRLAAGLRWFCSMRGHGGEVLEALNVLLERPDARMPTRTRARALTASCHLLNHFGDDSAIPSIADEAIKIARGLADDAIAADALSQLCWFRFEHGDLPAALARHRRSRRAGPGSRRSPADC